MLIRVNGAVQDRGNRHARDLLQEPELRAATSGAGLSASRTRAAGQTSEVQKVSEIGAPGATGAVTATGSIAVAPSKRQISTDQPLCLVERSTCMLCAKSHLLPEEI